MIWARESAYDGLITAASKRHGVPEALIKAVMAKESRFDPQAIRQEPQIQDASRGLMQLLLSTARALGYQGEPEGLFDPAASIDLGAKLLSQNVARARGRSWDIALAAYNAGWSTVRSDDARRKANKTFINQDYVNDVKVYFGYFSGQVPEATVKSYQRGKTFASVAPLIPVLGVLLALAAWGLR